MCFLVLLGSYLSENLYANPANGKQTPIPRHSEIKDTLCQLIRKQLGI